jgi:pimeloyl-ACP methyl ester carboxylesterase
MKKKYLWNKYGLRLHFIKSREGKAWNWLFLPGGPGLGSESLDQLTAYLDLPGTIWHVDFPGDGSNISENNIESFRKWPIALEEAVDAFDNVILVGHSSGGMYALSLQCLEHKLSGLILMDSAPDSSWQRALANMIEASPIAELERLDKIYKANPSNEILKKLTMASAPYFFTKKGLKKGRDLLQDLPYNYETCNWAEEHFDSTYKAKWFPQNLLTLIIAGAEDYLTPINLFKDHAKFNRSNILIREINYAGHFPWIENPSAVAAAFDEFLRYL